MNDSIAPHTNQIEFFKPSEIISAGGLTFNKDIFFIAFLGLVLVVAALILSYYLLSVTQSSTFRVMIWGGSFVAVMVILLACFLAYIYANSGQTGIKYKRKAQKTYQTINEHFNLEAIHTKMPLRKDDYILLSFSNEALLLINLESNEGWKIPKTCIQKIASGKENFDQINASIKWRNTFEPQNGKQSFLDIQMKTSLDPNRILIAYNQRFYGPEFFVSIMEREWTIE